MSVIDPIDIESATVLLRALANSGRLRIMLRLLERECAVATLELELGIRQPNLSQQLAELRDVGLVRTRRESRTIIYSIAGEDQRRLVAGLMTGLGGQVPAGVSPHRTPSLRPSQAAMFARVAAS